MRDWTWSTPISCMYARDFSPVNRAHCNTWCRVWVSFYKYSDSYVGIPIPFRNGPRKMTKTQKLWPGLHTPQIHSNWVFIRCNRTNKDQYCIRQVVIIWWLIGNAHKHTHTLMVPGRENHSRCHTTQSWWDGKVLMPPLPTLGSVFTLTSVHSADGDHNFYQPHIEDRLVEKKNLKCLFSNI